MSHKNHIKPERSIELLKELHILTVNWGLNQDSNRKLKQIHHLCNFLKPIIDELSIDNQNINIVDQWCGKSYLWFWLYDLYIRHLSGGQWYIYGVDNRKDLVTNSIKLAEKLWFDNMRFIFDTVDWSITNDLIPEHVDIVTALHACDTATDDTIRFALAKKAKYIVLVPCCQAEVCSLLTDTKGKSLENNPLSEIRRHPIHTRALGSHITNVMRCLWLESQWYQVTVTELVWREHSMKNELIIAKYQNIKNNRSAKRLENMLQEFWLQSLHDRYFW